MDCLGSFGGEWARRALPQALPNANTQCRCWGTGTHLNSALLMGAALRQEIKPRLSAKSITFSNVLFVTDDSLEEAELKAASFFWSIKRVSLPWGCLGMVSMVWDGLGWFGMVWDGLGNRRLAGGGGGLVWDGLGLVWMVWARLELFGPVRPAMGATQ